MDFDEIFRKCPKWDKEHVLRFWDIDHCLDPCLAEVCALRVLLLLLLLLLLLTRSLFAGLADFKPYKSKTFKLSSAIHQR